MRWDEMNGSTKWWQKTRRQQNKKPIAHTNAPNTPVYMGHNDFHLEWLSWVNFPFVWVKEFNSWIFMRLAFLALVFCVLYFAENFRIFVCRQYSVSELCLVFFRYVACIIIPRNSAIFGGYVQAYFPCYGYVLYTQILFSFSIFFLLLLLLFLFNGFICRYLEFHLHFDLVHMVGFQATEWYDGRRNLWFQKCFFPRLVTLPCALCRIKFIFIIFTNSH